MNDHKNHFKEGELISFPNKNLEQHKVRGSDLYDIPLFSQGISITCKALLNGPINDKKNMDFIIIKAVGSTLI